MSEAEDTPTTIASKPVLYPWQMQAWDQLHQKINTRHLPHALLLQGMADSGMEGFAQLLAQRLLCSKPVHEAGINKTFACGQCRECLLFIAGTHPGFLEILPLENDEGKVSKVIKIDQIRASIDFVMQTSMQQGMKVLLIHPAETMNTNAANALLKNLEEPPASTQFLLLTHNAGKLMPTIRSRCQVVDMALPAATEADQWLAPYVQNQSERQQLLRLSGGNPLLVKHWLDQAVTADIFALRNHLSDVLAKKTFPLALAKSWMGQGVEYITWWWRWLLVEAKQQAVHDPLSQTMGFSLAPKQLIALMEKLLIAKRQLESSANPNEQLLLESLLIDWQNQSGNP